LETRAVLRPLFAVALLLILAGVATVLGCASGQAGEPFKLVDMPEVERMLSQPDVAVIDANTKQTFEKNHLPGARHYKSAPFAEVLPADKTKRLVFYCASPS
jgi:hypothetical protein